MFLWYLCAAVLSCITPTWDIVSGTLTISGSGEICEVDPYPWKDRASEFQKVVIENGITLLPASMFDGCNDLVEVDISETVETISSYAFYYLSSLTTVTLREGLKRIEDDAFCQSPLLENIALPSTVIYLGMYAFSETSIKSITIPNGISYINSCVFYNCQALETCILPDELTAIFEYAFSGCTSLRDIELPASLQELGTKCFENCMSLTKIVIPSGVYQMGNPDDSDPGYVFAESGLMNVTITYGVTVIGNSAFLSCPIEEIELPETITYFGSSAFSGTAIQKLVIPDRVVKLENQAITHMYQLTEVTLKAVHYIGWNAFQGCSSLTTIIYENSTVPEFYNEPDLVFEGCTSVSEVRVPMNYLGSSFGIFNETSGVLRRTDVNVLPYAWKARYNNGLSVYTLDRDANTITVSFEGHGLTGHALWEESSCPVWTTILTSPTKLIIDDTISRIVTDPSFPFADWTALETIEFGNKLEVIDSLAFSGCTGLTVVNLSSSVRYIGDGVFSYCSSLKVIEFGCGLDYLGNELFLTDTTSSLETVVVHSLHEPTIGADIWPSGISPTVIVPQNYIGDSFGGISVDRSEPEYVFTGGCDGLVYRVDILSGHLIINGTGDIVSRIYIPGSDANLRNMPWHRFRDSITKITIDDGIRQIGEGTFDSYQSLTYIHFPASVSYLGASSFKSMTSLEYVEYYGMSDPRSDVTSPDSVFPNCGSALQHVVVYVTYNDDKFCGWPVLKSLQVPVTDTETSTTETSTTETSTTETSTTETSTTETSTTETNTTETSTTETNTTETSTTEPPPDETDIGAIVGASAGGAVVAGSAAGAAVFKKSKKGGCKRKQVENELPEIEFGDSEGEEEEEENEKKKKKKKKRKQKKPHKETGEEEEEENEKKKSKKKPQKETEAKAKDEDQKKSKKKPQKETEAKAKDEDQKKSKKKSQKEIQEEEQNVFEMSDNSGDYSYDDSDK